MDPDVDKHYKQKYFPSGGGAIAGVRTRNDELHSGYSVEEYHPGTATHDGHTDSIIALAQSFVSLEVLTIEPEDPSKPCFLATIPDELLLHILLHLSLSSLSSLVRVSQVCKKFLSLSQGETSLYKALCMHYFRHFDHQPPVTQATCVSGYGSDWRRMLIERPRLRFDGCYIATCHYLRPGVNDYSWNTPIHMVTYFRFVRFYPGGQCITVLTTLEPREVVHSISWGSIQGIKGVSDGVWKMSESGEVEIQVTGPRGYIFIKDVQVCPIFMGVG